jgi:uncharacterized protein (TIGR02231 family)
VTAVVAPIVAVVVLEDRASITRRASVALGAGQHRLTIERVAPVLVDKTLTATVSSGARVLDIRCDRYLAPWRDEAVLPATAPDEFARQLAAERERIEGLRDAALARERAAVVAAEACAQVIAAALRDLATGAARGVTVDAAAAELSAIERDEADARARAVEANLEAREAAAALGRLATRATRAESEAGAEAARLTIDLLCDAAVDVVISIGYVVPGAAWRPYHRAVLDVAQRTLAWQTTACVWQATGEDWTGAALTFSLERPSLGVEPPALTDDLVTSRKRSEVVVAAREVELETAGLGGEERPGGAPQVPGIDDGGVGLTLTAPAATVRADGSPHRLDVSAFTAPVELAHVAIPLRSTWAFVRARTTNTGTAPLLAGPVDLIMASGYIGRGEIGFVAAGEKFHIGFGPESDVRVHRTETRERDEAGLLGNWNVQTVRVAVRLSNLGAVAREIIVTERVPVSEVEQVEIVTAAPDAYLLRAEEAQVTTRAIDERGMVTWTVALPPLGRRAVTLEYKIRSQRGVAGV